MFPGTITELRLADSTDLINSTILDAVPLLADSLQSLILD